MLIVAEDKKFNGEQIHTHSQGIETTFPCY
jgi:hypothetical protein